MDLAGVRRRFVEITGRTDLVDTNYSNPTDRIGADYFINAAQTTLDLVQGNPEAPASFETTLSKGAYETTFGNARVLKNVFARTSTEEIELYKKDYLWLRRSYPKPYSSLDQAKPAYWTPVLNRSVDSPNDSAVGIRKILTMPPADKEYTLEIQGKFFTPELSEDEDVSYWSVVVPWALIYGAAYELEISYRNRQGAQDWWLKVQQILTGIDHDMVEEEMQGKDQMSNSMPEVGDPRFPDYEVE